LPLKIGVDKQEKQEKVEPTILEDGTKVWPKKERRKVRFFFSLLCLLLSFLLLTLTLSCLSRLQLRLLDVGAIAGTACSSSVLPLSLYPSR
jgi:hypothetical protein